MSEEKADHDGGYQGLFSHREMVMDMLKQVVDPAWLVGLKLEAMERVNTKYISDRMQRREGDVVWRIPYENGGVLYVCLMLEFQSRDDKWMTVRFLGYMGLLYQQMLEDQHPGKGRDRVLPLMLPIVLYNGDEPWTAPQSLRALLPLEESSPMWAFQPECCYHLIDEKRYQSDGSESLFAMVCEFEACQSQAQLDALFIRLRAHLRNPQYEGLRRAFAAWLQEALLPSKNIHLTPSTTHDLDEVIEMTRVDIPAQLKKVAFDEGLDKGEKIGINKGLRRSLVRVYERRFGAMPEALRARVDATHETARLELWLDLAVTESEEGFQEQLTRALADEDVE